VRASSRSVRRSPIRIVGLAITLVILKITWDSWHTVRNAEIDLDHIDDHHHHHHHH